MSERAPRPDLALTYLERPPALPMLDARPPLLILLHGVGSHERDLLRFADALDPRFHVLSVRAPLTRAPGSYAWFTVSFTATGPQIAPGQLDASRQLLSDFIGRVRSAYDADPRRVYLLGFSQGAIMSLTLALTRPELLGGVVAIAGRIPPEVLPWAVAPERTAGLPVLLEHGRQDEVLAIDWAHKARPLLDRQQIALTYREYDAPHTITQAMLADANRWLGERLDQPPWTPAPA
jgi:phospholipase/carboxylesterase